MLPGQVAIARHDGKICIVVCDYPFRILIGDASFDLRANINEVTIDGVRVAVIWIAFTLRSGEKVQEYHGYVNELESNVLESLGTMEELTVLFASHEGARLGEASCPNGLKGMAHEFLGDVSRLPGWTPAHFAGAVEYIAARDD